MICARPPDSAGLAPARGLPPQLRQVQPDPSRRMVARMLLAAHPAIDTRLHQARCECGVEQQVVDTQAGIAIPMLAEVIPEREDRLVGMQMPDRIGPALLEQALVTLPGFRLQQCILEPRARVVDVEV